MELVKNGTDRKIVLSTLWVFFIVNIIYADIISLMEVTYTGYDVTTAENFELVKSILSPAMLLLIAIILELGMIMIVLSRVLRHAVNRWANIIVAIIQALVLTASLFVGSPDMYYIFFATVELTTLLFIVWYAWTWPKPTAAQTAP
ncbi:DUF6326 family protein, partial [Marinobacter sp.]|uniref:DUF6326 family protein n=1 Tax=Marinobacter sp. TaxID=50741 RepID=UPI002B487B47